MDTVLKWVDILFKIALAIIAAVTTIEFNRQKQQNDDIKIVSDLAFSSNNKTAAAGIELAKSYSKSGRIPSELFASIVASINLTDNSKSNDLIENSTLRDFANSNAIDAAKTNPVFAKQVEAALSTLPARVYFHISRESDRAKAKEIEQALEEEGRKIAAQSLIVPGIQFVDQRISKTQVRCFKKSECGGEIASNLLDFLKRQGLEAQLSDQSATYENAQNIRPNHFEIWFGALQ